MRKHVQATHLQNAGTIGATEGEHRSKIQIVGKDGMGAV